MNWVDVAPIFDNILHKYQHLTHMSDKRILRLCIVLQRQIDKLKNLIEAE